MKQTNHLWKRIFSQYAFLISIAFFLIFTTVYVTLSNAMRKERRVTMEQQLEISSAKLDARVEEVMNLHVQLLNETVFRSSLQEYYEYGTMSSPYAERLNGLLVKGKEASWFVNTVYVLDSDFQIVGSSRVILSEDPNIERVQGAAQTLAKNRAFRAFFLEDGKLLFMGAAYLSNSYDYVTYIGMEISADRMFYNFTTTALESFQSIFVVAEGQTVCAAGNTQGIDPEDLDGKLTLSQDGVSYAVFNCRNNGYANWKIYALTDESTFHQAVTQQTTIVGGILILSILSTLVFSLLFAKRITRPLEQLTTSFHRLEQGEYPPPLEVESNDEVGQLIHSYNHVVKSLKKLNENIIAEQEEKRRFEIAAIKTRLDLLQSQIRPHFIHNTLNTLNYMAIEAGNTELSELITSFNALLRMSISTESDFCTVESEIACTKHYLRIQRSRYADRPLQCNYTVDEEAKAALLPRLVLQPLVENALYHGILPMEDRLGVIQVQCTRQEDSLCVSVIDNGVGISEEILAQIKRGEGTSPGGYNQIGIKNVKERIQLMYHQECEFKILSQVGSGTTIFFRVPYRR